MQNRTRNIRPVSFRYRTYAQPVRATSGPGSGGGGWLRFTFKAALAGVALASIAVSLTVGNSVLGDMGVYKLHSSTAGLTRLLRPERKPAEQASARHGGEPDAVPRPSKKAVPSPRRASDMWAQQVPMQPEGPSKPVKDGPTRQSSTVESDERDPRQQQPLGASALEILRTSDTAPKLSPRVADAAPMGAGGVGGGGTRHADDFNDGEGGSEREEEEAEGGSERGPKGETALAGGVTTLTLPHGGVSTSSRDDDPFSFASAADLTYHRGNGQCWDHFDFGALEAWQGLAQLFCGPAYGPDGALPPIDYHAGVGGPGSERSLLSSTDGGTSTWLRCRVTVDEHLPPATAPHTLCDGANVMFDADRLSPTACLASRPGYKCDGPAVHWSWEQGALGGWCTRHKPFSSSAFPNDHLKDMFGSWQADVLGAAALAALPSPPGPVVLLVARERGEHANAFHATTDFLNAFITLHVAGVIDGVTGSRAGMDRVQVLLLDEQTGPFDGSFWGTVFSPSHPVLRVSALQGTPAARMRLPRALFVPPGYSNMLLSHVASEGDCHAGTQLFQSYRRFVLAGMGIADDVGDHGGAPQAGGKADTKNEEGGARPLVVTFISRRPYQAFVDHSFVGRQIDNEEDVVAAMTGPGSGCEAAGACVVTRMDFAAIDARGQVAALAATDVLVGMHGAALTQALYLPPHGGVLELWPKPGDMWRCFEHIAAMAGLTYTRWENKAYPGGFRTDAAGDYTTVAVDEFQAMFREIVQATRAKKDAAHRPEKDHVAAAAAAGAG